MERSVSGVAYLGASGAISFPQNTFTQKPRVFCQIIRSDRYVFNAGHVWVDVINYNGKDSFSYVGRGDRKPGDQFNWFAVGI